MNDEVKAEQGLVPRLWQGPSDGRMLSFDFPQLRIGIAEYEEGPTGCTVLHIEGGADCEVDVRGGSPGLLGGYPRVDAISLAGGSVYGLEAATGVSASILAERNGAVTGGQVALVSGAIIYDFGGPRTNSIYPDKALGAAAYRSAQAGTFPLGARGAGRAAAVGKFPAYPDYEREACGQGAAFGTVGGTRIFVATVVNAVGVIVDRQGQVVRGLRHRHTGVRHHPREVLVPAAPAVADVPAGTTENTTLTVLVTDQPMPSLLLRQLARQVHSSMARAIQPFHTPRDGDVFFALSTATGNASVDPFVLAEVSSDLAWDAVLQAMDS